MFLLVFMDAKARNAEAIADVAISFKLSGAMRIGSLHLANILTLLLF